MKIKSSLVSSIMKEILLSRDQRIIHVEFGEIVLIISLIQKMMELSIIIINYLSIYNQNFKEIEIQIKIEFIIFYHNYTILSNSN